jgi:hypothetical protein
MLALIGSALIVLVLVAFFPQRGDNILRFCSSLVDLYQRWRQVLKHLPPSETEANIRQEEAQPQHLQGSSAAQLQQPHALETRGE